MSSATPLRASAGRSKASASRRSRSRRSRRLTCGASARPASSRSRTAPREHRRVTVVTNVEDLRQIARRRLPRALYDYAERGSYDELTLRANRADLDAINLRQRVLVDVSQISVATTLLGEKLSMPVAIAPTGMAG